MVLCVDGVHFDEDSPVLYVQREVISGEVLYAERRLAQGKDELVPMLRKTAQLAAELAVPIIGITSDKERSLVPAIAEAFPGVPHQFCQTHFLKNLVEPLKQDDQELNRAAKETVLALRKVQRTIERRFPAVSAGGGNGAARLVTPGGVTDRTAEATPAAALGSAEATDGKRNPVAQDADAALAAKSATELEGQSRRARRDATALEEARIAAALARAGTTTGMVSGRPMTDPVGLKRVQRLQQVRAAVEEAARKKGLRRAAGP
jgi:hypothetical protein